MFVRTALKSERHYTIQGITKALRSSRNNKRYAIPEMIYNLLKLKYLEKKGKMKKQTRVMKKGHLKLFLSNKSQGKYLPKTIIFINYLFVSNYPKIGGKILL